MIERSFHKAARRVKNRAGQTGEVRIDGRLDYEAFKLRDDEPSVLAAEQAVRQCGGEPLRAVCNGGLDANWLTARGIPPVSLGCGQIDAHTRRERIDRAAFQRACRIGLALATGEQ